jgi:hypothetical protein
MGITKGQGATEYLVLLGAVLIVALVALALLGYFPGLATDAKVTQSQAYWTSEAKPFAINDISVTGGNGAVDIVLQNKDASGSFTVNSIKLSLATGASETFTVAGSNAIFAPGETRKLSLGVPSGNNTQGSAGRAYEFNVVFNYTSPSNVTSSQYGGKPVMGKFI